MLTRRNFLTAAGLAGGSLSLPLKAEALLPAALSAEGERFSGFALLPPGAPPPFDLVPAHREPPVLCGTGLGRGGPELTGRTVELSSPEEAAGYSRLTLYALPKDGDRVLTGARVVEYDDAEIESVTLSWESTDASTGQRSTNLRLSATSLFPRPLPLWETFPVEPIVTTSVVIAPKAAPPWGLERTALNVSSGSSARSLTIVTWKDFGIPSPLAQLRVPAAAA